MHMGLFDDEYPYVVPVHYGYCFEDEKLVLYCHGASAGKKLDLIRKNPKVCVELECEIEDIDGGEIPCDYGSYFASVIGYGKAEILDDPEEKKEGLNCLLNYQTGKTFRLTDKMVAPVAVIRITVIEYTAKAKQKPV